MQAMPVTDMDDPFVDGGGRLRFRNQPTGWQYVDGRAVPFVNASFQTGMGFPIKGAAKIDYNHGVKPKHFAHPVTCYYWWNGGCNKSDEECWYAHTYTGVVANAPVAFKAHGGAVAGRNAMAELDDVRRKQEVVMLESILNEERAIVRKKELKLNAALNLSAGKHCDILNKLIDIVDASKIEGDRIVVDVGNHAGNLVCYVKSALASDVRDEGLKTRLLELIEGSLSDTVRAIDCLVANIAAIKYHVDIITED